MEIYGKCIDYLKGGRYLKLGELSRLCQLRGVVVHDEAAVLVRALRKHGLFPKPIKIRGRFKAWVVFGHPMSHRTVLLVGTGMGCTGSSIIIYELALQQLRVPILKVGTCVSVWQSYGVGTVFVPAWAVADEGVVQWDGRVSVRRHYLQRQTRRVFRGKPAVSAQGALRTEWGQHLTMRNWREFNGELVLDETAIWSSDAFYQLMLRGDFIEYLKQEHVIRLAGRQQLARVSNIRERSQVRNQKGWMQLVAWDMECAALFSAARVTKLQVAAALVVSWSCQQWSEIAKQGSTSRSEADGKTAHEIEEQLIVEAVRYLL